MSKPQQATVYVEYMHVCDYTFLAQNGKPGILGIFDQVAAAVFPATYPMMSIAIQFRGQPGHVVPFRVVLEAPDGAKVFEMPERRIPLNPDGGSFGTVYLMGVRFRVRVVTRWS